MDKKDIYHDLGFSIRKRNKDEIEIRPSVMGGYFRGLLRAIILGSFGMMALVDAGHGQPPFNGIYNNIYDHFVMEFNPKSEILPIYEGYVKGSIEVYNKDIKDLQTYEEFESDYLQEYYRWNFLGLIWAVIWPPLLLFLIFIPAGRGLRLNRKHRVIYEPIFTKTAIVPLPDRGDPLAGLVYDRFGIYFFGWGRHFSLHLSSNRAFRAELGGLFGVYPTPSEDHNIHLIQAMRAFFNEENPEFLNHIGHFYRIPWFNPLIFFCNGFSFAWPFSRRKAERRIIQFRENWANEPGETRSRYFSETMRRQQETNQRWAKAGFTNEVSNDWNQEDDSPNLFSRIGKKDDEPM